jgi:riboflavin biosynthesis pyrimidine reductase
VLVEGGAALACSSLAAGIVDRIALFVAPRLLGPGGLAWGGAGQSGSIVERRAVGADTFLMFDVER